MSQEIKEAVQDESIPAAEQQTDPNTDVQETIAPAAEQPAEPNTDVPTETAPIAEQPAATEAAQEDTSTPAAEPTVNTDAAPEADQSPDAAAPEDLAPEQTDDTDAAPVTPEDTQPSDSGTQPEDTGTTKDTPPETTGDTEDTSPDEDFKSMLDQYIVIPKKGQTLECVVIDVNKEGVYLNLSSKQTGFIPSSRLSQSDQIRVGDIIPVLITNANPEEAYIYCEILRTKAWAALEKARNDRSIVECLVTRINRGGIETEYQGVHIFVPGSKSGMSRNEDKSQLIGKTVRVRILETDRKTRRIIGAIRSERAEQLRENARKLWSEMAIGNKYEGTVKNMTNYAAFIDIGGIDGLAHVSQISYDHIDRPSDVLKPGDHVTVWVANFDAAKKRLNLTLKDPNKDHWADFAREHQVGDIIPGRVKTLAEFGAFVNIAPNVDGLVRISQISYQHVEFPGDVLTEGDPVNVKILELDVPNHRAALSMKGIDQPEGFYDDYDDYE